VSRDGRALGDQPDDLVVALGVERGEREVLELPLDRVHAQAVGQRREDLQRLAALLSCFSGGRKRRVRMLCSRSASLMTSTAGRGHRDDHLADRLGLARRRA
jgi:hypothetical protein